VKDFKILKMSQKVQKNRQSIKWIAGFFVVRLKGLEPARLSTREPKGNVTSVKGCVIRYDPG